MKHQPEPGMRTYALLKITHVEAPSTYELVGAIDSDEPELYHVGAEAIRQGAIEPGEKMLVVPVDACIEIEHGGKRP